MLHFALLCAFVAYASADGCCSMEDQQQVLKAWESLWSSEYSGRRVIVAQEVYRRLFIKAPETRALFKNVNVDDFDSPEFRAQCVRVANGMDTVINLFFDRDVQDQHLSHLSEQHQKYEGMRADYLRVFREAFAEVMTQVIPCFNIAAWNSCISDMHTKMAKGLAP